MSRKRPRHFWTPSWIEQFFGKLLEGEGTAWIDELRESTPIAGEAPGSRFRYSTAITQALVLAVQNASNLRYIDLFNDRIWSRIGCKNQFMVALAVDGTAFGGGINLSTPEDMLLYAMIYTPSWHIVSTERVVSDDLVRRIQTLGDPAAYQSSAEETFHSQWFGETGQRNSAQWDVVFADGAMFKHGNMHQGIYVDPGRTSVQFTSQRRRTTDQTSGRVFCAKPPSASLAGDRMASSATGSAIAEEAIRRIAELYAFEKEMRGMAPDDRAAIRQAGRETPPTATLPLAPRPPLN